MERWKGLKFWPHLKTRGKNLGGAFLGVFSHSESFPRSFEAQKIRVSGDMLFAGFACPQLYVVEKSGGDG